MAGRKSRYEKNLERMFDRIDPERRRPRPTLDQWLWAVTTEGIIHERIKRLSPEERLEGLTLEERLRGLDPELQERIIQVINNSEK